MKIYDNCRVCGSKLQTVFDLGDMELIGFLPPDVPPMPKYPLELCQCTGCGLVQLRHSVNPDEMYRNYWYHSGTNEQMVHHLHGIAKAAQRFTTLQDFDVVVDIGCNDGTLLDGYADDVVKAGFDPSNIKPNNADYFVHDFFSAEKMPDLPQAKIVTSIAMFYDLNDPVTFAKDVAKILHPDGVWVLELHYLPAMLGNAGFDAICHEHVAYYNMTTLLTVLNRAGLTAIHAEQNTVNGGSFRVFVKHISTSEHVRDSVLDFMLHIDHAVPSFHLFEYRVKLNKQRLLTMLSEFKLAGKTVYGYGASTKGGTMLAYWGLTPEHLPAIADRNPEKVGLTLSGIPIISETDMRELKPDYLLVFPYHFMDSFVLRERDWLMGGGAFIVPIPTPHVFAYDEKVMDAHIRMLNGEFGA